jgi:CheY-like chemotaxis protein
VESAIAAFQTLEDSQPDVLVSDIGMPEEDGYALIRKIRMRDSHAGGEIPAVALTAYASDRDRAFAMAAGFQRHIPKPVEPSKLADAIAQLARRSS